MTKVRPLLSALAVSAAVLLAVSGCAAPSAPEQTPEPAPEVTAESTPAPQRIVALDYESTEVLAEIGLADKLVLIPEAVLNPALGSHIDELSAGVDTFPVAMQIGVEMVLDYDPDLVVMSPRHGNEEPIADVLQGAGVPVLQLPQSWVDSASVLANIALIGEATGAEEQAAELAETIESGLATGTGADAGEKPRVLVLTNQAGRPFITAGAAYPLELLDLAGAQNIAEELGLNRTGPISAEQVVEADPDGIVLIDMNGTGDRMFAELLATPAVATLPVVSDGRILRVQGRDVQALGLANTVEGLEALRAWIATL